MQRDILNTKEAAEFLGLSPATLETWRSRGNGPRYVKLGRSVRYRLPDLNDYLTQHCRSHTSQVA